MAQVYNSSLPSPRLAALSSRPLILRPRGQGAQGRRAALHLITGNSPVIKRSQLGVTNGRAIGPGLRGGGPLLVQCHLSGRPAPPGSRTATPAGPRLRRDLSGPVGASAAHANPLLMRPGGACLRVN